MASAKALSRRSGRRSASSTEILRSVRLHSWKPGGVGSACQPFCRSSSCRQADVVEVRRPRTPGYSARGLLLVQTQQTGGRRNWDWRATRPPIRGWPIKWLASREDSVKPPTDGLGNRRSIQLSYRDAGGQATAEIYSKIGQGDKARPLPGHWLITDWKVIYCIGRHFRVLIRLVRSGGTSESAMAKNRDGHRRIVRTPAKTGRADRAANRWAGRRRGFFRAPSGAAGDRADGRDFEIEAR